MARLELGEIYKDKLADLGYCYYCQYCTSLVIRYFSDNMVPHCKYNNISDNMVPHCKCNNISANNNLFGNMVPR